MKVVLICASNHCCIHLKWVSFSSGYLHKQGQLPFFYLFGQELSSEVRLPYSVNMDIALHIRQDTQLLH